MSQNQRPEFFELQNGDMANLPFSDAEYENRLGKLRALMQSNNVDAMLLTSMHNIAYYSGFLYCSFGRPYACVVTAERCVTVSANIDGGQPWRRCYGENLIYTDWKRNNYWRAVENILGNARSLGIEGDHMTLASRQTMTDMLGDVEALDLNQAIMGLRMIKSAEEIELIKGGARTADIGRFVMRSASARARSMWRWPGAMPWSSRFHAPIPIANCATAGSGSSLGSTPTARITR